MSLSSEYEFEFEFGFEFGFETKRTSRNGVFPGGHPSKSNPARPGLALEDGWLKMKKYVLLLVSCPSVCRSARLFFNSPSATA